MGSVCVFVSLCVFLHTHTCKSGVIEWVSGSRGQARRTSHRHTKTAFNAGNDSSTDSHSHSLEHADVVIS